MDSKNVIDEFKKELYNIKFGKGNSYNNADPDIINKILDEKVDHCDTLVDERRIIMYICSISEIFNDSNEVCANYLASINNAITNLICYMSPHFKGVTKFLLRKNIFKYKILREFIVENDVLFDESPYNVLMETDHLFNEIEKLKQENEKLKTELLYQPGGQGMLDAKSNFESLSKK